MALQYVPYLDNFTIYKPVEVENTELKLPLLDDPLDISDWATRITDSGTPVVQDNTPHAYRSNKTSYSTPVSADTSSANLTFEELIEQEKLPAKITSSFRKNAKTKQGHISYHSQTDEKGNSKAYDIVPINGDFEDLLNKIYSNPRIVGWVQSKGYGILEEITPDIMKRTGATGKHLHIGPDQIALEMFNKRIKRAQQGTKIEAPYTTYENVEIPQEEIDIKLPLLDEPLNISSWAQGVSSNGTPIVQDNVPHAYRSNRTSTATQTSETSSDIDYSNVSVSGKKKVVYDYFINKGLKPHQAAAITGNLQFESAGLNHNITNSIGAFGLAQWLGDRKTKLFNKYGKNPSFENQLNFLWEELNSTEKSAFDKLLNTTNLEEATRSFMQNFERPSKREQAQSITQRIKYAKEIFN